MTSDQAGSVASSPYATGGGGTHLEQRFGAVLLSALLTGDPLTELGNDVSANKIRFQDPTSPIDDFVVSTTDDLRVSIGVRRAPALTSSDTHSVPLIRSYLRVIIQHRTEVESGRWRLALVVASPNPAVRQLRQLAIAARAHDTDAEFRADVATAGRFDESVRARLRHVDDLILKAADGLGESDANDREELTWRLLAALRAVLGVSGAGGVVMAGRPIVISEPFDALIVTR